MKKILLLIIMLLLTGCAEKEFIVKTEIKYIDICNIQIPDNLLEKSEIKSFPSSYEEKQIKTFINDLFFVNRENQFKIESIKKIYNEKKLENKNAK